MPLKVQKYAFICTKNLKICRLKNKNTVIKFQNNKKCPFILLKVYKFIKSYILLYKCTQFKKIN